MTLQELRDQIDGIDDQLIELLNQRYEVVQEVGRFKQGNSLSVYVPEREAALLKRLCARNRGPMTDKTLRAVYGEIMSGSRALEQSPRIAFLGPASTFTHQAAQKRFGSSVEYAPCQTIAEVFEAVSRDRAGYGVVPVENSTEGAVTHTLDMLADSNVKICAEIHMPIHHNLLCRCPMEDLQVIYSHPQVFAQCRHWLRKHLPSVSLVEVTSTTEAASRSTREPFAGALASALAAQQYDLPIAQDNIEDFAENTTRFLVLAKQDVQPTGDDKTSLVFVIRDRVGALYDSLQPLHQHKINLTMIESRPSRRKNWEYYFFVDLLGHISDPQIKEGVDELAKHCQYVKVLGSYPRAPQLP
jgi:chorismate mutase/prephenate dehydratase